MEKIKVKVYWSDKNYSCGWAMPELGAVMATHSTLKGVKSEFIASMEEHISFLVEDGQDVPQWLIQKDYEIEWVMHISAILRNAEQYTTMAALSRVTGINQKQLGHYASGIKEPRQAQRERIINGLHEIGRTFLSIG